MANQMILTKVKSTAHYNDVVAPANVTNGNFVALGVKGSDGTYTVAAPAAISSKGINIVCEVPLSYEAENTENDFVISTGAVVRARQPELGDIEAYPVTNFTATVAAAAGKYVIPDAAALKAEIVGSLGGTESVVYIIEKVFTKVGVSMLQMRCIKAEA